MAFDFAAGEVLLINKPYRWTSFDVVSKIRNTIKLKKIGHAGTLDPLATGLLILCTGKKTKEIESYQAQEKEYTGVFVIGQTTPSFDLETEVSISGDCSSIGETEILQAAKQLTGDLMQVPPMFSAVRVNGERLYKKARKGEEIEIQPRAVQVMEFTITKLELPNIHFLIRCSKGTYIRSIARDFGNLLGVGAYMSELHRTKIGSFSVNDAYNLEDFLSLVRKEREQIENTADTNKQS